MEEQDYKSEIKKLKEDYNKLKDKYSLPEFDKLAEEFDIEVVIERRTSFVLRDIRKVVADKVSAYLHLFETLVNPSSPPMFVFSALKSLEESGNEKVKEIYKRISKIEISVFKISTEYSERNEADFIKNTHEEWSKLKKDIMVVLDKFEDKSNVEKKETRRNYFG